MPNTLKFSHGEIPVARLCELFESHVEHGEILTAEHSESDAPMTPDELAGLLWDCTAIMPGTTCVRLGMHRGSNYAQGVRRMRLMAVNPAAPSASP
ncbi:MAG: hypothetical protein JWM76_3870 [Pseudonocardiales bacterium]|nr:hypothetical protein [Pseudonocardiales bacterium]